MKKMRFIFSLLTFALISSSSLINPIEANALENSGDAFELSDKYYDDQTSFVYSADLRFRSGQAGGLVFGAEQDKEYYVFNIDRYENKVKLLHFVYEDDNKTVTELLNEPYLGNSATTEHEYALINPKLRELDKIQLKVIISVENDGVHGEFFADNIKRFGIDYDFKFDVGAYKGGYLGLNCFNSNVYLENVEIGKTDYSFYTELYRNQFHYSQFARWNNDPNGLVYYNGYYHMYYQTHPFGPFWGDMYWGHARSKDLVKWELLPICLFPDTSGMNLGGGNGYMWSGSAMVYHRGMSSTIDSLNWFSGEDGLLAFYTRDGERQDQVIMTSEDGFIWHKRKLIPQIDTEYGKKDCRDPMVFPVKKNNNKTELWGMILSGDSSDCMWFLKSTDLVNWERAGQFYLVYENIGSHTLDVGPECPNLQFVDGKAIITSTSRHYIVGNVNYNESNGNIEFIDLKNRSLDSYGPGEAPIQVMDYGPDSYASQTFFIDDTSSEYYGKVVGINWFSGVPRHPLSAESGMFHQVRSNWNGGGFTIPVIYGLNENNELTQTPITLNNNKYDKTNIIDVTNQTYNETSTNLLEDVDTHIFELSAEINNPNKEDISFKINVSEDEYTEFGWNKTEGYYVDRSHTSDAGIGFDNYHRRYSSYKGLNSTSLSFYVLSDNGSLEVFCEGYSVPFYVLTLASPYSTGANLTVTGDVTINKLLINEIGSIWRDKNIISDEGVLYISRDNLHLDLSLNTSKKITSYFTGNGDVNWEIENENIISIETSRTGVVVTSKSVGETKLTASVSNITKEILIKVSSGSINSDIKFNKSGIKSGDWLMTSEGLIGEKVAGDGFILSNDTGSNFHLTANVKLEAVAASIVFRSNEDMTNFVVANYDNNEHIVKLWSHLGVIATKGVNNVNPDEIVLSVKTNDNNVSVSLNGEECINANLGDEYLTSGYYGLNVYSGKATFKQILLTTDKYNYGGNNLFIKGNVNQNIRALYNKTLSNTKINESYYSVSSNIITIKEDYFYLIKDLGTYRFVIEGDKSTFEIEVQINSLPEIILQDQYVNEGADLVIFIGNREFSDVLLNDESISYKYENYCIIISSSLLNEGENNINIVGIGEMKATLINKEIININNTDYTPLIIILSISGGVLLVGGVITTIILIKKKKGVNNGSNN